MFTVFGGEMIHGQQKLDWWLPIKTMILIGCFFYRIADWSLLSDQLSDEVAWHNYNPRYFSLFYH